MRLKVLITLLFCSVTAFSQEINTVKIEDFLYNKQYHIFDDNINTINISRTGWNLSIPVIRLNHREQLICTFDDFDESNADYNYTIVHCDPEWKPTQNIKQNEYMGGYYYDDIVRNYSYSMNTLQKYIHYSFKFPNENINIAYSGNYALIVYKETPEEPSFIARFYVCEDNDINIITKCGYSRNPVNKQTHQKLDITVDYNDVYLYDPYKSIYLVVQQNDRTYNTQVATMPKSITGNQLIFNYEDAFEFNGNNEFRLADLKSFKYLTQSMYDIQAANHEYHIVLIPEDNFKHKSYISRKDIDGNYEIYSEDAITSSGYEAEYGYIYFTLVDPTPPMPNKEVYICGNFNGWNFNEDNKMTYNYEKGFYEGVLFLKQGYYNYTYIIKDSSTGVIDDTEMDGNFYETKNKYNIFLYYKAPGDYYYRLIKMHGANSNS